MLSLRQDNVVVFSIYYNMEAIKEAFTKCKAQNRAALITYVTAGYPTISETPGIMLAMQAGGAGMCCLLLSLRETCTILY